MASRISVVMSTYNGKKYIEEQLESIKEQTVSADEVIISDDCSMDGTYEWIAMYIQKNRLEGKWKLIENKVNTGWKDNFHKLLYISRGDIVFLCDQDDIWEKNRIEEMVNIINLHEEINCLASSFKPLIMDSKKTKLSRFYETQMINDKCLYKVEYSKTTLHLMSEGCTMCVRKTFLDEIAEYWFEGWAHDEFIWKCAVCTGGMYRLNSCNLKRRFHSSNVSRKKMNTKGHRISHLEMELKSFEMMEKLLEKDINNFDIKIVRKMIGMTKLRIELVEQKKIQNVFLLLLLYWKYYQNKRSLIAEFLIAFMP